MGMGGGHWALESPRQAKPCTETGVGHSTLLGPFLICSDHDNMIYFIYKYPCGTGNNELDDIFQMASLGEGRKCDLQARTPFRKQL